MRQKLLKKYRQHKVPFIISLLITAVLGILYLSEDPISQSIIKRLDALTYDSRIKQSINLKVDEQLPPIIIIDIDEYSLNTEGRWPWSRHKMAVLIEKLHKAKASVIALDIAFPEPERNPANAVQELLAQQQIPLPSWFNTVQTKLDADQLFTQALTGKTVVLGYPFHRQKKLIKGSLHPSPIQTSANIENLTAINIPSYAANLIQFTEQAAGSGFFTFSPDDDGVVRKAPVVIEHNGKLYPSLAVEAVRQYNFEDKISLHAKQTGNVETISHITLGGKKIRTDAIGQILIPYQNNVNHFPIISASTLLHNEISTTDFENAIVLIGTSAAGLSDIRPTPVRSSLAGVKIQATIVHGLLHPETLIYTPEWADGETFIELILLELLIVLLFPLIKHHTLAIVSLLLVTISIGIKYWLWSVLHINLAIVIPLLQIITISMTYIFFRMLHENKQRKKIHNIFGNYVPLEHIDSIMQYPSQQLLSGQRREMSVLFSDIRDFTALSEHLNSKQLRQFLNRYLTPVTEIIFQQKGTIDKYVGDMVMAFWGAPLHDIKHAQHAVLAALDMQKLIASMQDEFKDLNLSHISAGIGIHTGEMNVGDMGSDYRRAYTVLGDAVNLGSRLESLTKFYGVGTLVSEDTCRQCHDISFRYIDYVRVKGRQQAVKIFEPIGLDGQLSTKQELVLEQHQQAFDNYLAKEWQDAHKQFSKLHKHTQDPLYALYISRIEQHLEKPPKEWDGVFKHHNK